MLGNLFFILKVELGLKDFNQKKDFDQILILIWGKNYSPCYMEIEL